MQAKFETQRALRQSSESKLLTVEKKNNELSVDMSQANRKITEVQNELQREIEKVLIIIYK